MPPLLQAVCLESVGELLPHPALHSLQALSQARPRRLLRPRRAAFARLGGARKTLGRRAAACCLAPPPPPPACAVRVWSPDVAQDKLVLVVFDRRSGAPVMFHMAFKAGYHHEVVLHLGLVMVSPQHQGQHLQRLCMLNMVLACLTYFTPSYVMTDIAASPSATKQVGDHMLDCFPNYRHNCSPAQGGGPAPWQLAVARFMMDYHRADFGTGAGAVLDESTLVVRGSNEGEGGARVLTLHGEKRRSRASRPNAFVESLLGAAPTSDELLHVGRASLAGFAGGSALRASPLLRSACMAAHLLTLTPALLPALLGRPDACLARFRRFAARTRFTVQVAGSPAVQPGGCLWVSNHFSWIDYPVLQLASVRLLRVVARADMGAEGVFGALAQRVLRQVGVIEYRRGDKGSGAAVRAALHDGLTRQGLPVLLFPEGTSQVEGPPRSFRTGGMAVAFEAGVPVQPVALWYSEPIGLAPETEALAGTANLLRYPTQAIVKFAPLLQPADYASADEFAAACETAVRDAYAAIAVDLCSGEEAELAPAADKKRE